MPFDQKKFLAYFQSLPKKLRLIATSGELADQAEKKFLDLGLGQNFKQAQENMISFIMGEISLEDFNSFIELIAGENGQYLQKEISEIWFRDLDKFLENKNGATFINPLLNPDPPALNNLPEKPKNPNPTLPQTTDTPSRTGPDPYREMPQ
ncbi:MAG TPA: hypothetical protein PKM84_00915 [Candidatus Pacearchaeota archaeon]|nr:hypothetical protein [Candidatus Pacearchaeota archaeon]